MTTPRIAWISRDDPPEAFPDISTALTVPDGLLAAGGDLAPERLLYAYRRGLFPWFDDGQPILWWSPDPRCVLLPNALHVARRLRRFVRGSQCEFGFNEAFGTVIEACASGRVGQKGTWITRDMIAAYSTLHDQGWAHSVEVWQGNRLVGGLYGLAIGRAFFGESMFSEQPNTSKIALWALCRSLVRHRFALLDCQVVSPHLTRLGARLIPRREFATMLERACSPASRFSAWPRGRAAAAELLAPVADPALQ